MLFNILVFAVFILIASGGDCAVPTTEFRNVGVQTLGCNVSGAPVIGDSDVGVQNSESSHIGTHTSTDDKTSETLAGSGGRGCPIKPPNQGDPALDFLYQPDQVLHERAVECNQNLVNTRNQQLRGVYDSQRVRSVYADFCNITTLTQCLTSLESDSMLCLDQVQRSRFSLLRGLLVAYMSAGCRTDDRGRSSFERISGIHVDSPGSLSAMTLCKLKTRRQLGPGNEKDPNSGMLLEHELLRRSKDCLAKEKRGEEDTLVNDGLLFWDEVMNSMMCLHPELGTEILCQTIISNLTEITLNN